MIMKISNAILLKDFSILERLCLEYSLETLLDKLEIAKYRCLGLKFCKINDLLDENTLPTHLNSFYEES